MAELLISGNGLRTDVLKPQVILQLVNDVRNKDEKWQQKKKSFKCHDQLKRKQAPSCSLSADTLCRKLQSKISTNGLYNVASFAQEYGIEKEIMLQKLVEEANRSHEWDMSLFLESLRGHCEIPILELTSLFYVANLSRRQHIIFRNSLMKYNVAAFEPRYKVDAYKKSLHPSVALDHLSASVGVQDLFDSTLHEILSNEDLFDKLSDLPVDSYLTLTAKVGLDGSGLHSKRYRLSGEVHEEKSFASSDSFLSAFMAPLYIYVSGLNIKRHYSLGKSFLKLCFLYT